MHLIEIALFNKLFNLLAKLQVNEFSTENLMVMIFHQTEEKVYIYKAGSNWSSGPSAEWTLHCTQDFTFYAIKHLLNSINPKVLLKYQEILILSI